jgi:hypothetical protein
LKSRVVGFDLADYTDEQLRLEASMLAREKKKRAKEAADELAKKAADNQAVTVSAADTQASNNQAVKEVISKPSADVVK